MYRQNEVGQKLPRMKIYDREDFAEKFRGKMILYHVKKGYICIFQLIERFVTFVGKFMPKFKTRAKSRESDTLYV